MQEGILVGNIPGKKRCISFNFKKFGSFYAINLNMQKCKRKLVLFSAVNVQPCGHKARKSYLLESVLGFPRIVSPISPSISQFIRRIIASDTE